MAAQNKSNELRIIRIYDAPLKSVWDAWTDPRQVAQWWGPRGFSKNTRAWSTTTAQVTIAPRCFG
ncbi:MAG: SRPBCC domain-containing protein [Bdellovibrionota bacterium]